MQLAFKKARRHNSTYKKLAVQWLNEAFPQRRDRSCFVSSFVVADSLVLRNRQLLVAAKRCMPCEKNATTQIAHLVFADTQANPKKPKELFFANVLMIGCIGYEKFIIK